jgi:hypothetical protein
MRKFALALLVGAMIAACGSPLQRVSGLNAGSRHRIHLRKNVLPGCSYTTPFSQLASTFSPNPNSSAYLDAYEMATVPEPTGSFNPGGDSPADAEEKINEANNTTPTIAVTASPPGHTPFSPIPFAAGFFIESPPPPADAHLLTLNEDSCNLYEDYGASPLYILGHPAKMRAASGCKIDLSQPFRPAGATTACSTATRIPMTMLAVTKEDLDGGVIDHTLGWDAVQNALSYNQYVYPAGDPELWPYMGPASCSPPTCIPMPYGSLLVLDPAKLPSDYSSWTAKAKTIAVGLETYGMYQYDTGHQNDILFACDSSGCPDLTDGTAGDINELNITMFTVLDPPPSPPPTFATPTP